MTPQFAPSTDTERKLTARAPIAIRAIATAFLFLYKAILYIFSFAGPVYLFISACAVLNAIYLVGVALFAWFLSGLTFLALLILTKKLLIGSVSEVGCGTIASPFIRRWFPAAMLTATLDNSPFKSMTTGMSLVGPWFFRAMGAKMSNSVLIGGRTLIYDPWFLEVGDNVTIGTGATILGHVGDGPNVKLGRVAIEAGAVVGVNAVLFPDVRVGENARVAAGAVVVGGTRIAKNEVWGGIPAKKISSRTPSDSSPITNSRTSNRLERSIGELESRG